MALFDERAAAALPDFDLSEHREAVEAICARVDGMPLAVELAAARVAMISPGELLARLDRSLGVLARGPRDLAERHRSLRAALEWTHELLEPDERTLLARLAAFAGPAPLDAVEALAESLASMARSTRSTHSAAWSTRRSSVATTAASTAPATRCPRPSATSPPNSSRRPARSTRSARRTPRTSRPSRETCPRVSRATTSARGSSRSRPSSASRWTWTRHTPPSCTCGWSRRSAWSSSTRVARARPTPSSAWRSSAPASRARPRDGPPWSGPYRAGDRVPGRGAPLIEPGLAALRATGDEARLELGLRVAGVFWPFADEPERSLEATREALAIARRRSHVGDLAGDLHFQAQPLVEVGRLDEAERLIDEAAPLVPLTGDSTTFDPTGIYADIAVERGNWALAARLYSEGCLNVGHNPAWLALGLQYTAIALAQLGADDEALELEASANSLAAAIGEALNDPLAAKHGWALREARDRVGPERAARAARRGRELPESESAARAVELVRAAGVTSAK